MFWDISKILSYNSLINIVLGARGCGKSFGTKKYLINRFIKHKEQFIYIRRYKSELKQSVPTFFNDIIKENIFPDHKLTVMNNKFYCDGEVCGYAVALSTSSILKSTSYSNVSTVLFDEFLIDKSALHYLQNEVNTFLDCIETIGRLRDIRVIMLGNSISMNNPYFTYFDLIPPYGNNIRTFKEGLICMEYVDSTEYEKYKEKTKFGRLIAGTQYGDYAIHNKWLKDSNSFIEKKSNNCKCMLSLTLPDCTVGIWLNTNTMISYCSLDIDPNIKYKFSLDSKKHDKDSILITSRSDEIVKYIIDKYRKGNLRFESMKIKNSCMDFINKFALQ